MGAAAAPKKAGKKAGGHAHGPSAPSSVLGPSRLAQVRLRADELEALQEVMHTLNLSSTSDALREGLRLLAREAAEIGAAEQIRSFHQGEQAPFPEGVAPASEAELEEVDGMQW